MPVEAVQNEEKRPDSGARKKIDDRLSAGCLLAYHRLNNGLSDLGSQPGTRARARVGPFLLIFQIQLE
jgi:hypothetical protein